MQILLDDLLDLRERERLDVILQRLQRSDVLRRDDVGTRRKDLPEFDVGRAHAFEGVGKGLGAPGHVRLHLRRGVVGGDEILGIERQVEVFAAVFCKQHEQIAIRADVACLQHSADEVARSLPSHVTQTLLSVTLTRPC